MPRTIRASVAVQRIRPARFLPSNLRIASSRRNTSLATLNSKATTQFRHGHYPTIYRCTHSFQRTTQLLPLPQSFLTNNTINICCHTASPRHDQRPRPTLPISLATSYSPRHALTRSNAPFCVCTVAQIHHASSAKCSIRTGRSALQCTWSKQTRPRLTWLLHYPEPRTRARMIFRFPSLSSLQCGSRFRRHHACSRSLASMRSRTMLPHPAPSLLQLSGATVERGHGEVDYYLPQLLSGHGYLKNHSQRYDKTLSALCPAYPTTIEDAEQAFFPCPRFHEERERLQQVLQEVIKPENIVRLMLETAGNWMAVSSFAQSVVSRLRQEAQEIMWTSILSLERGICMLNTCSNPRSGDKINVHILEHSDRDFLPASEADDIARVFFLSGTRSTSGPGSITLGKKTLTNIRYFFFFFGRGQGELCSQWPFETMLQLSGATQIIRESRSMWTSILSLERGICMLNTCSNPRSGDKINVHILEHSDRDFLPASEADDIARVFFLSGTRSTSGPGSITLGKKTLTNIRYFFFFLDVGKVNSAASGPSKQVPHWKPSSINLKF
ncbi:unnamed protein product [Trichogramma brassicae]|uniref:Uncharacterized protein n=1 Tax=Trichogramma brassicae TaxID=86971 RepID=A0A6H5I659_9HYME|nr:unnamed protein product [Trichogramma brassicae]